MFGGLRGLNLWSAKALPSLFFSIRKSEGRAFALQRLSLTRLLLLFLLTSCSPQTPEEFRSEGRREQRKLVECLSRIQTEEQLYAAKPELTKLFKEWGDLICAVHQFRRAHPEAAVLELTDEDHALNDQLKQEMRRLCRLRGGEEALAEAEKAGITRLKRL